MDDLIRRSWSIDVRAINETERSVEVIASTDDVDSYGEILVQDWDLSRYEKNPTVLWNHNAWGLPIGHSENVRVEKLPGDVSVLGGGKLRAKLFFVDANANEMGERVWQGFLQKSIRAVSVGFQSKQGVTRDIDGKTVFVLSGNVLVEISAVTLPANPNAVADDSNEKSMTSMTRIRALVGAPTPTSTEPPQELPSAMNIKTILAVLSLSETATEAEVIDKVKGFEKKNADAESRVTLADARAKSSDENVTKLLGAVGVDSVEKALGAITAGKEAVGKLTEQSKTIESLERAKLIATAKAEKKLSPAQITGLEGKSLDFVKGFIELQHPNPTLAEGAIVQSEKGGPGADLTHDGKTWDELKPGEKHALFEDNPELYKAMRDDAAKKAA